MQAIELAFSQRYMFKGKMYVEGKIYKVNDGLAKVLLSRRDERDIPYFRLVMLDEGDAPVVTRKKAKKKRAASKKKKAAKKVVVEEEDMEVTAEEAPIPENLDTSVIEEIEPAVEEDEIEPLPDELSDAEVLSEESVEV